jgi:ADP-ribosyl-[dinitrogen reductase] hydrolase
MNLIERYRGCLFGLAAGDALGASIEFKKPGTFLPVTTMQGGGPWQLPPGYWTDDTSMALCLGESLARKGFNPQDQMERYWQWYTSGYMSSIGRCFDTGNTCRQAIRNWAVTQDPLAGSRDPQSAGNGSLMRLAPVPMYYFKQPQTAIEFCGLSSRTTHQAAEAVDACRYYGSLIILALRGMSKQLILSANPFELDLCEKVDEVANGSFKRKEPPDIKGTGYVIDCMEAALWAFYKEHDFKSCVQLAVNLGDDADTTGAVCGQLAGAYYGYAGIPLDWREKLTQSDLIENITYKLFVGAGNRE